MIISFLSFLLLMWCVTLIDLWILNHPWSPGINLNWSWWMIFEWYLKKKFFYIYLFLRDRERDRTRQSMRRGGAEREGDTESGSRLRAPSCQHRARCGAQTHKSGDHDLGRSRTLNLPSHPGAHEWFFKFTVGLSLSLFCWEFLHLIGSSGILAWTLFYGVFIWFWYQGMDLEVFLPFLLFLE